MSISITLLASLPLLNPVHEPASVPEVDFLTDVWPILQDRCIECHGPEKQKGKVRLDTKDGLFGGKFPAVIPGEIDTSVLYELVVLPADDPDIMPAKGDPLTAAQVDVLRRWIAEGATWEEPTLSAPEPEPLALAPLDPAAAELRDKALASLAERGVHALQVAQGLEAIDVNASLLRERAGDADATVMEGLAPVLVWANFSGTALTDNGLASLGKCGEIRRLNLSRTAVTDAGMANLAGLQHLEYLNLYGTSISDAGLQHLASCKNLKKVFLWQTAVSDEGAASLAAALPGIEINRGVELAQPEAAAPVNLLCPVSGSAVDAAITSDIDEQLVAFCCANCKAKFDADPTSFVGKVEGLVRKPVNAKCPVSGAEVDASVTSEHSGQLVAFCCGNCKGKFDADPAAFVAKVEGLVRKPVNGKCPVSGADVDASITSDHGGKLVAFCCGKCKAKFDEDPAAFADKIGG